MKPFFLPTSHSNFTAVFVSRKGQNAIFPFGLKEAVYFFPNVMIYDENSKTCENIGTMVKIIVGMSIEYTPELEFMD